MTEDIRWARGQYRGYDVRLPVEPDDEITRVEPGSPCGEYMRRFWTPVAMSSQLADKPVAIRILSEELVIFRDGEGRVGLLHKHCAHRRASLEFGRIEKRGIRCCYHGWHFDVDGTILETPGEAPTSNICRSICQPAYPVREFKGLVFAYMGPPDDVPAFPYLDSFDLPDHELVPYSIHSPCNWLQETENAIDPYHSVFLHGRVNGPQFPGLEHFVELPVVSYHQRDAAIVYSHARRVGDLVMLRFHDYLLPNAAQNGGMFQKLEKTKFFGRTSLTKWVVPIDSTNSRKFGWRHFNDKDEVLRQGKRDEVGWEKVDFYGQTAHRPYAEKPEQSRRLGRLGQPGPDQRAQARISRPHRRGHCDAAPPPAQGHPRGGEGREDHAGRGRRGQSLPDLWRRHRAARGQVERRRGADEGPAEAGRRDLFRRGSPQGRGAERENQGGPGGGVPGLEGVSIPPPVARSAIGGVAERSEVGEVNGVSRETLLTSPAAARRPLLFGCAEQEGKSTHALARRGSFTLSIGTSPKRW
jgi:phenylpropionate dioxygenase-like ring-hydroxylating dioxygenase large terminal subunit